MNTSEDTIHHNIVLPGEVINTEPGFLRGLGTYISKEKDAISDQLVLISASAGCIERVNKLITVKPLNSLRYNPEVGDLVVGRVVAVENKRWKVDIIANREAVLQLSSVHLPGGEQRMRNQEDQYAMRELYDIGDCLSAEVQNINNLESLVSLHTRSLKYGLLQNGLLVHVPCYCMVRLPQHYISIPITHTIMNEATKKVNTFINNMDVILGKNGYIWITRSVPEEWKTQVSMSINSNNEEDDSVALSLAESLELLRKKHRETPFTLSERKDAARIKNIITILGLYDIPILPDHITTLLQHVINDRDERNSNSNALNYTFKDLMVTANVEKLIQKL